MTRTCDECGKDLVPFAGTWLCPDAAREIKEYEDDIRLVIEGVPQP